jgi:hypothetical protein
MIDDKVKNQKLKFIEILLIVGGVVSRLGLTNGHSVNEVFGIFLVGSLIYFFAISNIPAVEPVGRYKWAIIVSIFLSILMVAPSFSAIAVLPLASWDNATVYNAITVNSSVNLVSSRNDNIAIFNAITQGWNIILFPLTIIFIAMNLWPWPQKVYDSFQKLYRSKKMVKLKKDEEEVLYHIYKQKFMTDYEPFRISDVISEYIDKYNREDIIDVIKSLVSQGFIVVKTKKIPHPEPSKILDTLKAKPELIEIIEAQTEIELCTPNVDKIIEIKKLLRYRRGINWLTENIILTWQFIWKHFIVTIIVSAITTYIVTKYITHS